MATRQLHEWKRPVFCRLNKDWRGKCAFSVIISNQLYWWESAGVGKETYIASDFTSQSDCSFGTTYRWVDQWDFTRHFNVSLATGICLPVPQMQVHPMLHQNCRRDCWQRYKYRNRQRWNASSLAKGLTVFVFGWYKRSNGRSHQISGDQQLCHHDQQDGINAATSSKSWM